MSMLDAGIIVVYFVAMIGIGVWQQRRAAKSIENYFLGGNQIHWLDLAMSGSVSTFDISGTMWMVALVYLFGMKSIWNHWICTDRLGAGGQHPGLRASGVCYHDGVHAVGRLGGCRDHQCSPNTDSRRGKYCDRCDCVCRAEAGAIGGACPDGRRQLY